jgi:hypothetical protein
MNALADGNTHFTEWTITVVGKIEECGAKLSKIQFTLNWADIQFFLN